MGEFYRRIHYLLHRRRLNAELESDMEFHREMAAREGSNNFGNALHMRELAQETWGWSWLDHLLQDFRAAIRGIERAPGSALAMVVLLALGMGGVAALFGPLYSLVLRPLPFPDSGRLVRVDGGLSMLDLYADYTYFKDPHSLSSIFTDEMAFEPFANQQAGAKSTVDLNMTMVTAGFFKTLGVQPRLGRTFSQPTKVRYDASDYAGAGIVVSDEVWRTRLHSERDLAKCTLQMGAGSMPVIGVMPPGFDFPFGTQIWVAGHLSIIPSPVIVGRVRPELSRDHALVGLKTILGKDNPVNGALRLESLHDYVLGDRRPQLWMLSAVSGLFLALACAGVANLLLTRGVRRRPEMVIRQVLGAKRGRLIRLLLAETLLLSAAGGALGLALSVWASYGLRRLMPDVMEGSAVFSPVTVAAVAVLVLAVTIICGIAPAFHATGADLNSSLKAGVGGQSGTKRSRFFTAHELFAGGQLAIAMLLLVCTALLVHSLFARLNFPLGFNAKNMSVVTVNLTSDPATYTSWQNALKRYPHAFRSSQDGPPGDPKQRAEFYKALEPHEEAESERNQQAYRESIERLSRLPGVESVALLNDPPFSKRTSFKMMSGQFYTPDGGDILYNNILYQDASPNAFGVLGIPFLAGRTFQPEDLPAPGWWKYRYLQIRAYPDQPEPVGVAIVNARAAQLLWPNQNPLGKILYRPQPEKVIGVVGNIHESRDRSEIVPTVYLPFDASHPVQSHFQFIVKLRPGISQAQLAAMVKSSLPPGLDPPAIDPLEESNGKLPMVLTLLGCFAALGMVVAGLGVYATATLMAASRTRELGIRMAMGASAGQMGRTILWLSIRMALAAVPAGAFGAWALGRSLTHWLFAVKVDDPVSYVASGAVLFAIALAAGLWPAVRAATTDPSRALRYDG